ncbi:unnamed protein product [Didymodactylos carnosus]|uniref:Uncharacterized protein n=1 Tax=Didymodactylos carnosus TaxID=1234261 RepID=A0A8S2W5D7_9BILA|nr:unnamed protein product [Didymodactylos carnosus]CAF4432889.1 unnamed protein product [Didymodactylos carnosus]
MTTLKLSIDTLYICVGFENFIKLMNILELKLINSKSIKLNINKLTDVFYLLSSFDNFSRALILLNNFNVENWLLYLDITKIEYDLNKLFHRRLDESNVNNFIMGNLNNLDEFIELKFNEIEIKYENSFKKILNTLKMIELNGDIDLNEKEMFFGFLRARFSFELEKDSNYLMNLKMI